MSLAQPADVIVRWLAFLDASSFICATRTCTQWHSLSSDPNLQQVAFTCSLKRFVGGQQPISVIQEGACGSSDRLQEVYSLFYDEERNLLYSGGEGVFKQPKVVRLEMQELDDEAEDGESDNGDEAEDDGEEEYSSPDESSDGDFDDEDEEDVGSAAISVWDCACGTDIKRLGVCGYDVESVRALVVVQHKAFGGTTTDDGSKILVFDVRDPSTIIEGEALRGHRRTVYALCVSPQGDRLYSGSSDGDIRVWDITNPVDSPAHNCVARLSGHEYGVNALIYIDSTQQLVSASQDETVRLWSCAVVDPVSKPDGCPQAPQAGDHCQYFSTALDFCKGKGRQMLEARAKTALAFDDVHGLLFVGDEGGNLTCFAIDATKSINASRLGSRAVATPLCYTVAGYTVISTGSSCDSPLAAVTSMSVCGDKLFVGSSESCAVHSIRHTVLLNLLTTKTIWPLGPLDHGKPLGSVGTTNPLPALTTPSLPHRWASEGSAASTAIESRIGLPGIVAHCSVTSLLLTLLLAPLVALSPVPSNHSFNLRCLLVTKSQKLFSSATDHAMGGASTIQCWIAEEQEKATVALLGADPLGKKIRAS
jgi:hypothetical protein